MKWWFNCWLLLFLTRQVTCESKTVSEAKGFMENINRNLTDGNVQHSVKAIENLEKVLEMTEVMNTTSLSSGHLVALLDKSEKPSTSLTIYANKSEAKLEIVPNNEVIVHLPRDVGAGPNNTVVFCMITLSETNQTIFGAPGLIYENRLVGLSVSGKIVSRLQERVNITINGTTSINETQEPRCVFLNFSTQNYSSDGCQTFWKRCQTNITCSCEHLAYFGVLLVNSSPSSGDQMQQSSMTCQNQPNSSSKEDCQNEEKNHYSNNKLKNISEAKGCMENINSNLTDGKFQHFVKSIQMLENILEITEVINTTSLSSANIVALLDKPKPFTSLTIYASNSEAKLEIVPNCKVIFHLPRDVGAGPNNTVVFCMITLSETNQTITGAAGSIYENRLVGLSVSGKNVSGLQERVNITMNVTTTINETQEPRCVFLNFSTDNYSSDGCQTLWERGQTHITCSCDHLTYFGVLMVNSIILPLSPSDQKILSYITQIGCSLSLLGLSITVLLYITHKKFRADVSMKVHISLVFALILLNVHFLPSEMVAALSSNSLCVYMALALHYSLLATFSWMALEGFHLYLLLMRVFNIYIRRYLLKLSVVGWGFPAVIVSLVVIIDRTAYGYTPVDSSNPNGTAICYVTNTTVMMVTTMGMIGLVFLFNVIMLGVTVRRFISLRQGQKNNHSRVKKDIFTLLGISTLLGITWGVGFFSITTAGQYIFCILNSLQGFFIFLWFVMSLRKTQSSAEVSNATQSTTELKRRK